MTIYTIAEWRGSVSIFEVEAEPVKEAKLKVQNGEGQHIPEHDQVVDVDYMDLTGDFIDARTRAVKDAIKESEKP